MKEFINDIEGVVDGTDINRANLFAAQGFMKRNTTMNANNQYVETHKNNEGTAEETTETLTTTITSDGTIITVVDVFVGGTGLTITKTTTYNADGSITEVLS